MIPVVVGDKNTESLPKVFKGFDELYGEKTSHYIKTTPLHSSTNYLDAKPVYIVPYFLIGKLLADKE